MKRWRTASIALLVLLCISASCDQGPTSSPTGTPTLSPPTVTTAAIRVAAATTALPTLCDIEPSRTATTTWTIHTAQFTPTARATATRSPTPAPTGRLLREAAVVDLAGPAGNLYSPNAAALDRDTGYLYVLGAQYQSDRCALAQVDPTQPWPLRMTPVGGYGTLAVGDGRVYVVHTDDQGRTMLQSYDAADLTPLHEVSLEAWVSTDATLVVAGGYLYLPRQGAVEVWDADTLALNHTFAYPDAGPNPLVAHDPVRDAVYICHDNLLERYGADTLVQAWARRLAQRLVQLTVDPESGRIYAVTERYRDGQLLKGLVALNPDDGRIVAQVLTEPTDYPSVELAGAFDGRVYALVAEAGYRRVVVWDDAGNELARGDWPLNYGVLPVADPARDWLHLVISQRHLVQSLALADLAVQAEMVLGIEVRGVLPVGERVYVNDSAGRLHALDAQSGAALGRVRAGDGIHLTASADGSRLYVPSARPRDIIAVVDTASMAVVGELRGGDRVALDEGRGRIILGQQHALWPPFEKVASVWDAETLERLAELPRGGVPAYNPLRDELYLADYSAYIHDGEGYAELGELTPDIGAQPIRGCNGCRYVRDMAVDVEQNLLALEVSISSAGKGAGLNPAPRFFSLDALEPITEAAAVGYGCGGQFAMQPPVDGVVYKTVSYARYVYMQNLVATEAGSGVLRRWIDGLNAALVLPEAGVIYAHRDGDYLLSLNLETWQPLGLVPNYCVAARDAERDRLYAVDRSRLILLESQGGAPLNLETWTLVEGLESVRGIHLSPDYVRDETLYVHTDQGLLRSTDGGGTWFKLNDHVAGAAQFFSRFDLAYSPDYAQDRTLFLAAERTGGMGYGVLRSTDGGDTWEPVWDGLQHLLVRDVELSPDFAQDDTLVAYARYHQLYPTMSGGQSVYMSRDRGDHWFLVRAADQGAEAPPLPEPAELLSIQTPRRALRLSVFSDAIERTDDAGHSWETVLERPEGEWWVALLTAADWADGGPAYALTAEALYRSLDGGDTWERGSGGVLDPPDEGYRYWQAAALALRSGGGETVLLGDSLGGLHWLRMERLRWAPVQTPVATPMVAPVPSPTAECQVPVDAALAPAWQRAEIGCPLAGPERRAGAVQSFEHGRMFWFQDVGTIVARFDSGYWIQVDDTWTSEEPDYDLDLTPPDGLLQPVRGFGKVWRAYLGGPTSALGWAIAPEAAGDILMQRFQGGTLLLEEGGAPLSLRDDLRATP